MAKIHFQMSSLSLFYITITILSGLEVTFCVHSGMPYPPLSYPTSQLQPTSANIWTHQPKCRSANAQVYFLPTAPKPAKVTVLTEPTKAISEVPLMAKEIDIRTILTEPTKLNTEVLPIAKEIDIVVSKLGVPPPPPQSAVLPGVLDEIPTIIAPVEENCPCVNRKSRILEKIFERTSKILPNTFNYDQDLLDGFLSSLGL